MRFLQSEKSEIVATLARLCLKEKLYIVGRMGKLWLGTPQNIKKITVAFQSKKPVGWCFLYDNSELFPEEPTLGVFVLPNYRGFNLGRVMIERTIENFGNGIKFSIYTS